MNPMQFERRGIRGYHGLGGQDQSQRQNVTSTSEQPQSTAPVQSQSPASPQGGWGANWKDRFQGQGGYGAPLWQHGSYGGYDGYQQPYGRFQGGYGDFQGGQRFQGAQGMYGGGGGYQQGNYNPYSGGMGSYPIQNSGGGGYGGGMSVNPYGPARFAPAMRQRSMMGYGGMQQQAQPQPAPAIQPYLND